MAGMGYGRGWGEPWPRQLRLMWLQREGHSHSTVSTDLRPNLWKRRYEERSFCIGDRVISLFLKCIVLVTVLDNNGQTSFWLPNHPLWFWLPDQRF